jgi:hypothetical protein
MGKNAKPMPAITAFYGEVKVASARPLAAIDGYRIMFDLKPTDDRVAPRCAPLSGRRRPAIEQILALPMDAAARRSTPRLITLTQSTRIAAYAGERRAISLQWGQPRLLRLALPACLRLLASFACFVC